MKGCVRAHPFLKWTDRACLNCCFEASDLVCLRTFGAFDDVELYLIAFFEGFVAVELDGAVVNEDVGSPVSSEEPVPFCVIEPLDDAFELSH